MLIGECIRHPLRSSHVRALKMAESAVDALFAKAARWTGGSANGGGVPSCGCHSRQPSNDAADEYGSMPGRMPCPACLRKFART
jgi:hypothetical protein